ncbi:MarR family winged helix-turn-helix transcriptional regulator [Streptomyces avicenniae]|uniref:MarR family winged helix-turn-helix transcriptional regulator n=1 Tax=Streptomyces avicenniae TaxID=500153 RepID=UPI00069BB8BB|nr:MarR family transcriptional regulator [Streptomyces avicenniae]
MTAPPPDAALPDAAPPGPAFLGTRLRLLLDTLDRDVQAVYTDLGLPDFRPRFAPVVRAVAARGALPIREVALAIGVTHSAASQTVAQMAKEGLVSLTPGDEDARQRLVRLTPEAEALLPRIDAEWAATERAAAALETELPYPLSRLVTETLAALERRPLRERIGEVQRDAGE